MSTSTPLLSVRNVSKRFPGVLALDNVSLDIFKGEVLSLVGENGAGKSTLMKILAGVNTPDEGQILIDGQPVRINNVRDSKSLGISLIHQELLLAPNLDVAGNIFLGQEPRKLGALRMIDRSAMHDAARKWLERVGLDMPPDTNLRKLTTGQMQMVEIAKALSMKARVLIMDEPTSSLTAGESERLFEIINSLRSQGISIIYISHRMDEIRRLSDRIAVLRDGKRAGDLPGKATHDEIISKMVGRELGNWFPKRADKPGDVLLKADNVIVPGAPAGVSFEARKGEILGFAGLVGSGRTELMRVIFGVDQALGGSIELEGERFRPRSPADAIKHRIYLVPEDRKLHGLVLPMSVAQNTSLPAIATYSPRFLIQRQKEREVAREYVQKLNIKTPSIAQKAVTLSGGNQQKIVLGKWLAMNPKILILDEPTRGIDVGAKAEIYRQMADLADQGMTIIMVSSELEEVIGMSDRVVVMRERRIAGELPREQLTEQNIMALMTGKVHAS